MKLLYLNKGEKESWLPRMFELYYENMATIAPSGMSYEAERAEWMSNVGPALDKAPRQVLLALDEEKLAGFVMYYTRDDLLMVEEVQIRRENQGGLLFLQLCRKLLADLPEQICRVEAYAHRGNDRSRKLMARLGMEELPEDSPFVHLRGDARTIGTHLGYPNSKNSFGGYHEPL